MSEPALAQEAGSREVKTVYNRLAKNTTKAWSIRRRVNARNTGETR
jgi:hypothetical protein